MVSYDRAVIQELAERLYARAQRIIVVSVIIGILIGAPVGPILIKGALSGSSITAGGGLLGILGAGIGGYIGYIVGQGKAFKYKLEAQIALCQVQIERNTQRISADTQQTQD